MLGESVKSKPSITQSLHYTIKKLLRKQQPPLVQSTDKTESYDPIDENAFHYYPPSYRGGEHRSVANIDRASFNLHAAAARAKSRAVSKNVDSILAAGDDDQITLALRDTLGHDKIQPYAARLWGTVFSEEASVGRLAVEGMREIANKIATTKNKGMLSKTCRTLLSVLGMVVMKGDESDKGKIRSIYRQILPNFSLGAAQRILDKAGKKRKRFDMEDLSEFDIIEKELLRCKYSQEEIDNLREWMVENIHTRTSPMKEDTVQKRDTNGKT